MTCKGLCGKYKAIKPQIGGRYSNGQSRCQICEIFIKWDGDFCPCCNYRLRKNPRNIKYKGKLRDVKQIIGQNKGTLLELRRVKFDGPANPNQ